MVPDIWGRFLWYSIHFIAMDYPEDPSEEDRRSYKEFFENLWKVIPCYKCGVNYKRHLLELPVVSNTGDFLRSKEALFTWTVELHNIVNTELGKPTMSVGEAKAMYSNPNFVDPKSVTMAATMRNESEQKERVTQAQVSTKASTAGTMSHKHIIILISVLAFLLAVTLFMMRKPKKIRMR
jgi:hypothetical protein